MWALSLLPLDSSDPIDRYCPRDKYRTETGAYLDSVDTSVLFRSFSCRDTYKINMSKVPPHGIKIAEPDEIPLSNPVSTTRKDHFFSSYNQLIGAVVISQQRQPESGACLIRNNSVARYRDSAAKLRVPASARCVVLVVVFQTDN